MNIALSVGGSSMLDDRGIPKIAYLRSLAKLIKKSKHSFGILCGGGVVARHYAAAAREIGAGAYEADSIAITATRMNAQLLLSALVAEGVDVHEQVLTDFDKAKTLKRKVVVMGGTIPGLTTDTDTVLLAEAIGAKKLVNISNIDGIYDSNPKENPGARKFTKMSYEELISLALASDKRKPGTNFVFDMLACKLIARSAIETHFVKGELGEIEKAIEGKEHKGTVVR